MADVTVPYPEVGLAAFEQLDNYDANNILYSGSFPAPSPGFPLPVTANLELQQFAVVTMTAGKLAMATFGGTKPTGVLTQHVIGDADGETTVPVFYTGCFNPDALVWDDSFDTPEKKAAAFQGAASPTQVIIRARG